MSSLGLCLGASRGQNATGRERHRALDGGAGRLEIECVRGCWRCSSRQCVSVLQHPACRSPAMQPTSNALCCPAVASLLACMEETGSWWKGVICTSMQDLRSISWVAGERETRGCFAEGCCYTL